MPPASAAAFANIGGAVLGSFPAGVGQNFTLANYSPAAPLAAFGISGGLANQAVVDAGLAPVVAMADATTQAQYAVAQIQMGNQNPSQAPTLTATNSARRRHGDPRWHALLGHPGHRCRHSRRHGPRASRPRPSCSTVRRR